MKKLLTILTILVLSTTITLTTNAQKAFIQAGVSAGVDKVVNENLEVGAQSGHNRISLTASSFDGTYIKRQYLAGVKYVRAIPVLPNFDLLASVAAKTNLSNVAAFVFEPGAGVDFHLGRGVSFITGLTSPITQNSFKSRTLSFAGNAGLKFDL